MEKFLKLRGKRIRERINEYSAMAKGQKKISVSSEPLQIPEGVNLHPENSFEWWNGGYFISDSLLIKKAPKISDNEKLIIWIRKEESDGSVKIFEIPLLKLGYITSWMCEIFDDIAVENCNEEQNKNLLVLKHPDVTHDLNSPCFWKNIEIEERGLDLIFEADSFRMRGFKAVSGKKYDFCLLQNNIQTVITYGEALRILKQLGWFQEEVFNGFDTKDYNF